MAVTAESLSGASMKSPEAFRTRFFRWFNAFQLMKFVHHARDHFYPDCEADEAARWLLHSTETNRRSLLTEIRKRDRHQLWQSKGKD